MSELSSKLVELTLRQNDPRASVGTGRPLSPEQGAHLKQLTIDFPSFDGGINFRDAEQDQEGGFTQETVDVEITERGRIRRMAGHMVSETMESPRSIDAVFVHTSLDFVAELVLFDSPYIGIKAGAAATSWDDQSLPDGDDWVGIPYGEDFLFTNGADGIYTRAYGSGPVAALIAGSPPAKTLFNFAGRVFAGGVTTGGVYQALGIMWVGADSLASNWAGLGSGFTLLISNNNTDDRIVAGRVMGFDLAVVLCQKSIWIGRRTGDTLEPATFEPRVQGVGCISEPTARLTPKGVMFLSESGVYVFDGNTETLLSGPINDALLPVLTNVSSAYSAVYDQVKAQYWLFTPTETWVYEMKYNRWTRSRMLVHRAVAYSEQFSGITWDNILATWNTIAGTWASLTIPIGQERVIFAYQDKLAVASRSSDSFLDGQLVYAMYGFLRRDTPDVNSLFTTQRVLLRKIGAEVALDIRLADSAGGFQLVAIKTVPDSVLENDVELGVLYTGRGSGAQIRWTDASFEISKAQFKGMVRSKRLGVL